MTYLSKSQFLNLVRTFKNKFYINMEMGSDAISIAFDDTSTLMEHINIVTLGINSQ